jgi:hypothetical protein
MDPILLNTKAVDLMRQGKLKEATSDLRAALGELLRRFDQRKDVDLADKVTPTFLSIRSVPFLEESLSIVDNSSNQDHHAFSLFDRALVIENAELADAYSVAGQSCATAVVMYNMGLALQLQGMQDLRSKQANFNRAMRFYQMASTVLEGCTGSEYHVSGLLHLAVSNNMGHIYMHFCNTSEAQRCLTRLFTILQAMGTSGTEILCDEYLPFHLNIVVLRGQHALGAAAA